jgi:peptide deformylase
MTEILQLGDPRLREVSAPVADLRNPSFMGAAESLRATLSAFRRANGWGRAISAPQIGVPQRFIALDLGEGGGGGGGPRLLINPQIVWSSSETFTMWDDCMSFSALFVRLRRYRSISVEFEDENGEPQHWFKLEPSISELLQHEIDHLDGILAIDRAIDRDSIVLREVFEAGRSYFAQQVDYTIPVRRTQQD